MTRGTEPFDLEDYLLVSVEKVVRDLVKAAAFHPAEARFMAKYALASRRAAEKRRQAAARGEHIPPFLIASITSQCNLRCAGCYARSLEFCGDEAPAEQLSAGQWASVFRQARDLGVSFILLAGGEPLVRWDVIEAAAGFSEILFPVFTNGTMLGPGSLDYLSRHRNLLPVLSIEGGRASTDRRRGEGVYDRLQAVVRDMGDRRIAFAVSITVTKDNLEEVLSDSFLDRLSEAGCKGVVYVEYVPIQPGTEALAPDDKDRARMADRLDRLRQSDCPLVLLSFPGDEAGAGGCLAAGRGFFHINPQGGAEPCPFSPFSDFSLKDGSLRQALASPLFRRLQNGDLLTEDHTGGCVLFQKQDRVKALLSQQQSNQEAIP